MTSRSATLPFMTIVSQPLLPRMAGWANALLARLSDAVALLVVWLV